MTRITDNTRKALQHREISVPQRFFSPYGKWRPAKQMYSWVTAAPS